MESYELLYIHMNSYELLRITKNSFEFLRIHKIYNELLRLSMNYHEFGPFLRGTNAGFFISNWASFGAVGWFIPRRRKTMWHTHGESNHSSPTRYVVISKGLLSWRLVLHAPQSEARHGCFCGHMIAGSNNGEPFMVGCLPPLGYGDCLLRKT